MKKNYAWNIKNLTDFCTVFLNKAHCATKPPFCLGRRTAAFRSQTSRRKKTFQVDELHRNRSPNQAAADAPPVAAAAAHVALVSLPTRRAIVFQPQLESSLCLIILRALQSLASTTVLYTLCSYAMQSCTPLEIFIVQHCKKQLHSSMQQYRIDMQYYIAWLCLAQTIFEISTMILLQTDIKAC